MSSSSEGSPAGVDDSELRRLLGYQLRRAGVIMQQRFSLAIGVPFGLRQIEFYALTLLTRNDAVTHKQISMALAIAPSNMVGVMGGLEQRGLVTRRANPSDGRSFFWELTTAGARLERRVSTAAAGLEKAALRQSATEPGDLADMLDRLWSDECGHAR